MKGSRLLGQGIAALASDDRPAYDSLRDYLNALEKRAALRRVDAPVNPELEVTELCHRAIRNEGPALWFENPTGSNMPLVGNVYGTEDRVSAAIGLSSPAEFRAFGKKLAWLKSPELPSSISGAIDSLSRLAASQTSTRSKTRGHRVVKLSSSMTMSTFRACRSSIAGPRTPGNSSPLAWSLLAVRIRSA